jgi:hypothetical protein
VLRKRRREGREGELGRGGDDDRGEEPSVTGQATPKCRGVGIVCLVEEGSRIMWASAPFVAVLPTVASF